MRYIIPASFLLVFLSLSCNSDEKSISPKEQFDKLEKIFPTANWEMIDGGDTSYLYFSRLGDLSYKIYDYKLEKGDSSVREISQIGYVNNSVCWMRAGDSLRLAFVDSTSALWHTMKDDKPAYSFKIISSGTLSKVFPGDKQVLLKQTLPLATFLVRSKYDYINNTHTIDSPLVSRKDKKLQ